MSDELTDYGFKWGPIELTRLARIESSKRDTRILQISTDAGKQIVVYVSRTGRSLRVFRDGEELK